jgi:hypothetical protein
LMELKLSIPRHLKIPQNSKISLLVSPVDTGHAWRINFFQISQDKQVIFFDELWDII